MHSESIANWGLEHVTKLGSQDSVPRDYVFDRNVTWTLLRLTVRSLDCVLCIGYASHKRYNAALRIGIRTPTVQVTTPRS